MKVIDIPEKKATFTLLTDQGDKEFNIPFIEWLTTLCKGHKAFHEARNARQYSQIMEVIEAVNGEKVIRFGESDYQALAQACDTAVWIHPDAGRAYIPFDDAFKAAQTVDGSAKDKAEKVEAEKEK